MYEYTFTIGGYIVCKFVSDSILSDDEAINGFILHNDLGVPVELKQKFFKTFVVKMNAELVTVSWNREYISKHNPEKGT